MDKKLIYIAKTLSRTKRKDYENYVINSIWNGVKCQNLIPVSQQCIKNANGKYYFIDLYFPQLNIGIECDEQYHEKTKEKDTQREIYIFDILKQVVDTSSYKPLHVKITERITLEDVDQQINDCIKEIKEAIKSKGLSYGWDSMFIDPYKFYKDKEYITVADNVTFKTTKDVYNIIFAKRYNSSPRKGGITLENGFLAWFPQLAINGKARASGWYNEISTDGNTIYERNVSPAINQERKQIQEHINQKRVVFTKTKDLITGVDEYRFVGVFEAVKYEESGILNYKKIDDKFRIIRNRR